MPYQAVLEIAHSNSLKGRIVACVAKEGIGGNDPVAWVQDRLWAFACTPGWDEDWQYAVDNANSNVNPDTGARLDVIDDNKILAAVQAINGT